MGLVRTVPPDAATSLVSVAEASRHLSLADESHDEHLAALIATAVDVAERWTNRALLTQTWRLSLDEFPASCRPEIKLPQPPLQQVTSVEYVDADGLLVTLDPQKYNATADAVPGLVEPAYGETWPTTRSEREAVRVTFVAGYGSAAANVPEPIRQAILLLVGHWFQHREPTVTGTIISDVPMSAVWLLNRFMFTTYA